MEFKQNFFIGSNEFIFYEHQFTYKINSFGTSKQFNIKYEYINNDYYFNKRYSIKLISIGSIFLIMGLLPIIHDIYLHRFDRFGIILCLFSIPFFLIAIKNYKYRYYSILTPQVNIQIYKDKKSELILQEIYSKRNHFLIGKYGKINYNNSINEEINKFKRLRFINVINNLEYKQIKNKILNNN